MESYETSFPRQQGRVGNDEAEKFLNTDTFRNIRNDSHGIKGDHAGSDASIGVTTSRSLKPVKSME